MTHPTPSAAIAAGACALCLGDGQTFHIVLDRLAACSACGGTGRLDDMFLCTCRDPACPDHGTVLWPAGQPSWAEGYLAAKPLDVMDEWLTVVPLTFGRARLCVATRHSASLEHWCLDSPGEAIVAWLAWPTPPTRWNRHQRRDGVLEWPDGHTEPEHADARQMVHGYQPTDVECPYCGCSYGRRERSTDHTVLYVCWCGAKRRELERPDNVRVEPIEDYVVLLVPDDVALDDERLLDRLTRQAERTIFAQYRRPPRALVVEPIDWLITSDPAEVERHQPAHDCVTCRAGNDQARAYLTEHPDRHLALGNLRYTEVWT